MNLQLRMLLGLIALSMGLTFAAGNVAAEGWKSGVAKVKITPEKYMWMAGYGARTLPASGKLTELWAKALVLEDSEGKRAVLVTLDLVGIHRETSQAICAELEQRYKLSRPQVAICCSHTHSGPVVGNNLPTLHYRLLPAEHQKLIDEYTADLRLKIVAVVSQAIDKLAPCELSWGSNTATFAVNRRNNKEADVPQLREAGQLKGPSDHDVPVLAVKDSAGKLLAVACGYACHATVLSGYGWSGDYPGHALLDLEAAHPDCIALFWAGCGADQNPIPRRKEELAAQYGKQLAESVEAVLTKPLAKIVPRLSMQYEEIALPLGKLPTRDELTAELGSANKFAAARAQMLLSQIDVGQPLAATYPYPVQTWKLGSDVKWVFLGGEVVVDFAIRIKADASGTKPWIAGYANDVMAYIPSRRVLIEGGYEGGGAMVYYGLPTSWAPEVEETIIKEVERQTGAK